MDLLQQFLGQVASLQHFWMPFLIMLVVSWVVIWRILKHHYQGRLDTKDDLIKLKEERVQDYKDKLSGATPDEARARMDALEARIDALGPRKITAEQRQRMIPELELFRGCKVEMTADATSADAAQLSRGLAAAFNAAGWSVRTGVGIGFGHIATRSSGIILHVENPSAPTDSQQAIGAALRAAGLEFDLMKRNGPSLDVDGSPMESITLSDKIED